MKNRKKDIRYALTVTALWAHSDDTLLTFLRKQDLMFHANRHQRRCMKCQSLFSGKK